MRDEFEQWHARISQLNLPTLIIWGAQDTWIGRENADRFHRDISGSKLVIIPECGHLPQEEKPAEFSISLLDFMSEPAETPSKNARYHSGRSVIARGVDSMRETVRR